MGDVVKRALAVLALALAGGCRLIAGIDHVELGDGGMSPEGGDGCAGSCTPTQVFTRGNEPIVRILSDGQYVYALLSASIVRCRVTGCGTTPDTVVPTVAAGIIGDFALDARLYYSIEGNTLTLPDGGAPPANDGVIHAVDKNGMNDQAFLPALPAPRFMAIAGDLYWFDDQDGIGADNPINSLRRCPLTGGCGKGVSVIDGLGGLGTSVAADSKSVYVLTGTKAATSDGVFACGTGQTCGMMPRIALTAIDNIGQNSIATDGTNLFLANNTKGDIVRVDQQNIAKTLAGGQSAPAGIATDGKYVYWGTVTGSIMRIGVDGGNAQTVATSQAKPSSLIIDAVNVYFVVESGQGSTVMALPKPP